MVRFFKRQGYEILALGRRNRENVPSELFDFVDYATYEECEGKNIQCGALIHTAGLASETASINSLNQSNVELTQAVFKNFKTSHFIQISSASVYPPSKHGHTEDEVIQESNISDYGLSKLKAEQWLIKHRNDTPLTILRPRAIYGVGDQVLLPRLMRLKKGPVFLKPHPLRYQVSMTCIELLLEATKQIIEMPLHTTPLLLNIADKHTYSLNQVFERVGRLSGARCTLPISENILKSVAALGLSSNITTGGLNYFLTDHFLDTSRLQNNFGPFNTPHFLEYFSVLQSWFQQAGHELLLKNTSAPWHQASIKHSFHL